MSTAGPQGGDFQQQVLRRFTALMLLRADWAGELTLACSLDQDGAAFTLASHIAGAVCLSIEADVQLLKAAQRSGVCDFAVNTLDEALRTMKNELRRGRALGVGLRGDPSAVLQEIVERGLLPVVALYSTAIGFAGLREMGTQVVEFSETQSNSINGTKLIEDWAQQQGYSLQQIPAAGLIDLRELDRVLKQMVAGDSLRLRWQERAPQHFQREKPLHRAVWLTKDEASELHSAGREF